MIDFGSKTNYVLTLKKVSGFAVWQAGWDPNTQM